MLASTSFAAFTAAAETRAPTCGDTWGIAPIVPTSGGWGVQTTAASSASDAWVVSTGFSNVGFNFPTPQHWDGTTWTVTPLPDTGVQWLYGVAAIDPSDAWAVGYAYTGYYYRYRVMITHWDGSSWRDVPSPGRLGAYSELNGIDAVSADDMWAVGYSRQAALIEHWDGTSWSIVPSQIQGSVTSGLDAVSFDAPDDGWAVGSSEKQRPRPNSTVQRPLLLHWDGDRWTRNDDLGESRCYRALWRSRPMMRGRWVQRDATVALHWNGVAVVVVPTPSPGILQP